MEKYRMSEEQERGRPPLDLLPGEVASSEVQDGDASGGTRVGTAKNETSDAIEKPTILKKDQKSLKYVSAPQLNLDKKDSDELSAMMMASKMAKKDDQTPELVANDAGEIEESPVSPMFSAMAQANQSRGGHRTSESDILAHQGVRVVLPWDQAALPQKKEHSKGRRFTMLSIESQFGPSGGSGSPGQSQTDGGDAGEALDRVTEELGSIRRELSSGKLRSFRGMQEALKGDDGQGRAALTSNTPETATDIQRLEVDFRPLYDARAKKVMGMRPLWLSDLVKDLTRARMKKLPRYRRIENLRAINSVMQTEQDTWSVLTWALSNPDQAMRPATQEELDDYDPGGDIDERFAPKEIGPMSQVELRFFKCLRERRRQYVKMMEKEMGPSVDVNFAVATIPGPVGDVPVHQCFLLGQVELGKKVVDALYFTPLLLNHPYDSDIRYWQEAGVLGKANAMDKGLYTGQTLLHIAINLRNPELVHWLLERHADMFARAVGAFFSPKRIRLRLGQTDFTTDRSSTFWQEQTASVTGSLLPRTMKGTYERVTKVLTHFVQWVQDVNNDPDLHDRHYHNKFSSCYYGQYPLSFASSLGEPELCQLLINHLNNLVETRELGLSREYDAMAQAKNANAKKMSEALRKWALRGGNTDDHPAWNIKEYNYFTNAQDGYGNTALHLAVLHGKKETIRWLCTLGGASPSLDIMNEDGRTPLTLAVETQNVRIFKYLLRHISITAWSYGGTAMIKTPLSQIDSFRIPGLPLHEAPRWKSALEVIVECEYGDFSHVKIINTLVDRKWEQYGLRLYLTKFLIPYIIYLIMLTAVVYLRSFSASADVYRLANVQHSALEDDRGLWTMLQWFQFAWSGSRANDSGPGQSPRLPGTVLEYLMVILVLPQMVLHGWRVRRLKKEDLVQNGDEGPSLGGVIQWVHKNLIFFLINTVCILSIIALICGSIGSRWYTIEIRALGLAAMLMWTGVLLCMTPFKFFGVIIITMWQMLADGIFKFLVTYFILVTAFSQGLFALYQLSDSPRDMYGFNENGTNMFVKLVWVSLGDTRWMEESIAVSHSPDISLFVFCVYLVLVAVLMINLLVAMMSKAFRKYMHDSHKTWFFPFAHLVLRLERIVTRQELANYRVGTPGKAMERTSAGYSTLTFFDVRVDKQMAQHRADKQKAAKKRQRVVLDEIESAIGGPMEECHQMLSEIETSLRDMDCLRTEESRGNSAKADSSLQRLPSSKSIFSSGGTRDVFDERTIAALEASPVSRGRSASVYVKSTFGSTADHVVDETAGNFHSSLGHVPSDFRNRDF